MFFGKPRGPMGAPMGAPGPAVPGAAPFAVPGMPPAAPFPPSGLVNLDIDAGPGLVNMDIGGPYPLPGVEQLEADMEMQYPGRIHVVLRGDTVWKLSRKYNISMQAIIQANNLRYPDVLFPGQRLVIPDGMHYSNY